MNPYCVRLDSRVADVALRFNRLTAAQKFQLMETDSDLYFAVARAVRMREVSSDDHRRPA